MFSSIPLWVAIFISGFCNVGIITLVLVMPTEFPRLAHLVASSIGFIFSLGNIGPFIFPIAVGHIKDKTGSFLPAMIMLAIIVEITPLLSLFLRENGKIPVL